MNILDIISLSFQTEFWTLLGTFWGPFGGPQPLSEGVFLIVFCEVIPEGFWEPSRRLLEVSWGHLEAFWGSLGGVLGRSGALLRRSWPVLGRSWGALGALLDALGRQEAPKSDFGGSRRVTEGSWRGP